MNLPPTHGFNTNVIDVNGYTTQGGSFNAVVDAHSDMTNTQFINVGVDLSNELKKHYVITGTLAILLLSSIVFLAWKL